VSGRSREATPKRSPYNLLCDIELDVPAAATGACGGVAMMRAAAFDAVGGFDTALAAGEEPELCLRLRRRGWLIDSLVAPMMQHELGIDRFAAWWRRSARGGRAYFESWWKHRGGPEAFRRREVARIVLWGGVVPALIVAAVVAFGAVASSALLLYAWPFLRAYRWARRGGHRRAPCLLYAAACVVGKFAEFTGALRSWWRLARRPREYARS
jgi:GT2 family glycosyltransferase